MPIKYNDGTKVWTPKYALYNGTSLSQIYYGSTKVFEQDGWSFSSTTPGEQTIHIPTTAVYDIHIVGGGGGATHRLVYVNTNYYWYTAASGGSGGHVWWWQYLEAGDYTITIGAGGKGQNNTNRNGGNTVFLGQTAGGGTGGDASSGGWDSSIAGVGGTNTTDFNSQNGNNGTRSANDISNTLQGGASVYAGFGAGGSRNGDGGNGGVMITFKSLSYPTILETSTPGTYTIDITDAGEYGIKLVGGGGGGHTTGAGVHPYNYGGGSGAYVYGSKTLSVGSYTAIVGAAGSGSSNGGDSSFDGEIAGGGKASTNGGGVATTTLSYINGNNGSFGNFWAGEGGASVYPPYGNGATASNGGLSGQTNGYVLICKYNGK